MSIRDRRTELKFALFETGWGWMGLVGTTAGLSKVVLPCESSREVLGHICCCGYHFVNREEMFFTELTEKLKAYFRGSRVEFNEELDLFDATPFRIKVWNAARAIPYGQTRSYIWLADRAGVRSARAVGQALNKNPFPFLVPCHRVIGSSGKLVGFAGGLDMKRRLLELEACR